VSGPYTVAEADAYWRRYYSDRFVFGQGTEHVLAALTVLPPVESWIDLGSGSESLLWAIALRARRLFALDVDSARLARLRRFTAAEQPRGIHRTALRLCHRRDEDFAHRCRTLTAAVRVDCLTGQPPRHPLVPRHVDLLTQFGLLGLCRDAKHFTNCFSGLHRMLRPGGFSAGANWVAADPSGRVQLTEALYRHAAEAAGLNLTHLSQAPSTDPDFPAVWIYTGRTPA
jgi:hypothetical protein